MVDRALDKLYENMRKIEDVRQNYINNLFTKLHTLEYLTGYSLDDILKKVAAGYRLEFHKPPNIEFSETAKLADLVIGEED